MFFIRARPCVVLCYNCKFGIIDLHVAGMKVVTHLLLYNIPIIHSPHPHYTHTSPPPHTHHTHTHSHTTVLITGGATARRVKAKPKHLLITMLQKKIMALLFLLFKQRPHIMEKKVNFSKFDQLRTVHSKNSICCTTRITCDAMIQREIRMAKSLLRIGKKNIIG